MLVKFIVLIVLFKLIKNQCGQIKPNNKYDCWDLNSNEYACCFAQNYIDTTIINLCMQVKPAEAFTDIKIRSDGQTIFKDCGDYYSMLIDTPFVPCGKSKPLSIEDCDVDSNSASLCCLQTVNNKQKSCFMSGTLTMQTYVNIVGKSKYQVECLESFYSINLILFFSLFVILII